MLEPLFAPYELLCVVGSSPRCLYVVRNAASGGHPRLLVAERFDGMAKASDARAAEFVSQARRISTIVSPNIGRVRELVVRGDDLIAFSEFIDGDKLGETWLSGNMPIEVALRVVLDVLSGLSVIHGLRGERDEPLGLAHGEVSPATIAVGLDGAARLLYAIARRAPGAQADDASLGYLAPEVHMGQGYGPPADVFGAGVLLWEALTGERLFPERDPEAIVARVRSGGVPHAAVPAHALWAKGLIPVAAKALSASPEDRWPSAAAMTGEIRKAVGMRLASAVAAASYAKAAMGTGAKARRERLERKIVEGGARVSSATPAPVSPPAETSEIGSELGNEPFPLVRSPSVRPHEIARRTGPPFERASPLPHPPPSAAAPESSLDEAVPAPVEPRSEPAHAAVFRSDAFEAHSSAHPAPVDPFEIAPTSIEKLGFDTDQYRWMRRLRVAVLAGVGALGVIVFALAGWRTTHRDKRPWPPEAREIDMAAAAPAPDLATSGSKAEASQASPADSGIPAVSSAAPRTAMSPPSVVPAPARPRRSGGAPTPAQAVKANSPQPALHPPPAPPAARPKNRPSSG